VYRWLKREMETLLEETAIPHPPVYYRWRDERSPLIVELKIDIVPRMLADLLLAEEMGMEGGGVLIGCFPKSIGPPMLRIDDFEAVSRRAGDGLPYLLIAEQRQRFTTVRKKAATRELSAVGYFRSHLRTGPFELSVEDRDLMSAEFKHTIHVALLIAKDQSDGGGAEGGRHLGTYFVSVNGIIQNRVDPIPFPFNEGELNKLALAQPRVLVESRPLPKAQGDEPKEIDPHGHASPATVLVRRDEPEAADTRASSGGRARRLGWAGVALLALATLVFVILGWNRQVGIVPGSSSQLALNVTTEESGIPGNQSLHVTWNHANPLLATATKAVLTISDRGTHKTIQEFELGPGDLAAGSVKVDLASRPVEISLVLWMPDSTRVTQVAEGSS
jgi:hypothetical protein